MPSYTPHATWVAGDVPVAADLNNWETGIDQANAAIDAIPASSCCVYNNTSSAVLASASYTKVILNAEQYDVGGEFDITTYRFTAAAAGNYLVANMLLVSKTTPAANEQVTAVLYKNGALYGILGRAQMPVAGASGSYEMVLTGSLVIPLAASDYLELYVYPSASNWIVVGSHPLGRLCINRIS